MMEMSGSEQRYEALQAVLAERRTVSEVASETGMSSDHASLIRLKHD